MRILLFEFCKYGECQPVKVALMPYEKSVRTVLLDEPCERACQLWLYAVRRVAMSEKCYRYVFVPLK